MNDRSVGVFDSGVGGLSVLREIRRTLPGEDLLYVADSGYAPYGDRPRAFIEQRSTVITEFLIAQGAKAIVVACNTATGMAVEHLRARFALPIVAMEPAVKPAASATRSGVVAVLATTQTLASARFARLVEQYGAGVEVVVQAAPGLVDAVEEGRVSGDEARALVESYVRPVLAKGADTIVLGCTHFPFLGRLIQEAAGPGVLVIDPAIAVARELARRLEAEQLLSTRTSGGTERFWTTGDVAQVLGVVAALWPAPVDLQRMDAVRVPAGDQSISGR